MKRILMTLCALAMLMVGALPAYAAGDAGKDSAYYPISVEEYTAGDFDELRIQKVYQLSLDDDPSLIPSDTNNMEKILQTLDAEIEATTEDGYALKTGTVSATRTYPNLSEVSHS